MSVLILLGSKSDQEVAKSAVGVLKEMGIPYKVHVASAHRDPRRVVDLVERSDAKVFIGIAGASAALPGVIAAHTTKPVIGVPVSGKVNLDAILSVVQMPPGVPVAAVGLDRGDNAALLAAQILATSDAAVAKKVAEYKEKQRLKNQADSKEIEGL